MLAIHAVPAFNDNYLWVAANGRSAAVVDPGDAAPIERFLDAHGLTLTAILATHHHGDHVGGLMALKSRWKCPTFGPAGEAIAGLDTRLAEGDRIEVPGIGARFEVLDVPGHTAGHIAYAGEGVVFCGDTLFACGCGRLFEGTPAQMSASLAKLTALPGETRAYCAHEYTMANIRFALTVEPGNADLLAYHAACVKLRNNDQPTLPSSIAQELLINPFLRSRHAEVRAAALHFDAAARDDISVFAALRQWKNQF